MGKDNHFIFVHRYLDLRKPTLLTLILITGILIMGNPKKSSATEPSLKKWWQQPVRMMRRDYLGQFEKLAQSDLNQLVRETRELWHCNAEWIMGSLGCSPGLAHITTFDAPGFEKLATLGERGPFARIPAAGASARN